MLGWFRDNQHRMLVFFTVMLMAGFGVMGVLSNTASNGPSPAAIAAGAKPVKAWKLGSVTDKQLRQVRYQRQGLQALQFELLEEARKYQENFQPQSGLLFGNLNSSDASDDEIYNESFRIMLLAQKAQDMGMVVSEATADAYFSRFVDQWVPFDQIKAIANEVGARDRFSYADFREFAKREILASYAAVVCVGGKPSMPSPTQAFQYYKRMTEKIECQVLGFPVEDYMAKVSGTPSDSEIKSLFEEGKYFYPAFDRSRPGFKIENRLQLQYFAAELATFTDKFKAELSDELIQREYDRLVSEKAPLVYDAQITGVNSPLDLVPGGGEASEEGEESASGGANDDSLPALPGTESNGEEMTGDDGESKEEASAAADDKPLNDKPPGPKTDGSETGGESASIAKSDVIYVVAQEEDGQADSSKAADQETAAAEGDAEPAEQGKIRPLEEVREEIKTSLAQPKAFEEMERIFASLKKEILLYRTDLRLYEAAPETEKKPEDLDFEALAKKYNLTFRETGAMDYDTFVQTALGMSGAQRGFRLADQLFQNFDPLKRFSPEMATTDVLVWVKEKYPAEVPTLEDARDEVVEYWKYQEAIKLAEAAAKEKADSIGSGKLMKEVDDRANQTGGFTWYTSNMYQGVAQVSQMPGVEKAGEEFMETAFGLPVNATGVAMNADKSIAYAIQKTADAGLTEGEMRENFLKSTAQMSGYPMQVPTVAQLRVSNATSQFLKNLQEEYDCKDLQ